ncbi:7595_t:CDS:2 [Diversispora eburnea]|uniref:7595_t:CDS:1 n=1 Tax=Diversispora eburnea TaxID=1213867 RepID=A0A9N9A5F8_9GLOM|nr:7595_t:CDS:2 [Diversispora eburnea]
MKKKTSISKPFYIPTSPLLNSSSSTPHFINYNNMKYQEIPSNTANTNNTLGYEIVNKLNDFKKEEDKNKSDLPFWKRWQKKFREEQYHQYRQYRRGDIVLVL